MKTLLFLSLLAFCILLSLWGMAYRKAKRQEMYIKSSKIIRISTLLAILILPTVAFGATEVDNLTGGTYDVLIHPTGGDRVADSFTASVNANTVDVTLSIKRSGTVGHTGYIKIWTDSSGSPGTEACSADVTDSDGNTSTYSEITKTLTNCGLTQGSTYWAGFQDDTNNGSAYFQIKGDNAGSWKGYNSSAWANTVWTFDGSWHETSNADLLYKVVTTDSGTGGGTNATSSEQFIDTETRNVYYGFILFFISFFGIIFYFKKGGDKK